VRKNIDGTLYSLVFAKACSVSIDPIEKKPLYHFMPGTNIFSVATVGCNFRCQYCQNWEISQPETISGEDLPPEKLKQLNTTPGFAWTYTEPTVFYEYFYETAKITTDKAHVWVTNGYTSKEAIKKAAKFLDAVNVDYKGPDDFYKKICSASLEPVQQSLKLYKKLGIWIEITNLLIPGYNTDNVEAIASWIKDNLGADTPLHLSAYHPMYKLNAQPTSLADLEKAHKTASKYLNYVYIGNIDSEKQNTFCPNCGTVVIARNASFLAYSDIENVACTEQTGYSIKNNLINSKCHACGFKIPVQTVNKTN
jgi:pyruvate formate lyase activating enzyme